MEEMENKNLFAQMKNLFTFKSKPKPKRHPEIEQILKIRFPNLFYENNAYKQINFIVVEGLENSIKYTEIVHGIGDVVDELKVEIENPNDIEWVIKELNNPPDHFWAHEETYSDREMISERYGF